MLALGMGGAAAQNLTIATGLQLNTMDPHFFNGFPAGSAHPQIFDALTEIDETLQVKPGLATAWRLIDPTTWEFDLRPGVRFHDGTPFTAADITATFARVPTVPNSPALFTSFIRPVKEVVVVNDRTIRIITHAPTATLPGDLARVLLVAARDAGQTTSEFNAGRVNGTGPYRFAGYVNSESLSITRNDAFWGTRAPWQNVTIRTIARDPSRVAALLAGDVDAIDQVPTGDKARITADPRFRLFSGPAAVVHYIALDSARPESPFVQGRDGTPVRNPLMDARVRQALSMAIDRNAITQRLMEGSTTPASQFLPNTIDGTSPNLRPTPYDPARARALLAEAGWPQGFQMSIGCQNNRFVNDEQICQAVAQMLTRIGVRTTVDAMPHALHVNRSRNHEFSFWTGIWNNETGEPASALVTMLATVDEARGRGQFNRGRYSNPEFDSRLDAALAELDDAKREALLIEATGIAFRDVALIALHHQMHLWAHRAGRSHAPRLDGYTRAMDFRPE
jgi:peptide/nickel transport system substrate-binding protein